MTRPAAPTAPGPAAPTAHDQAHSQALAAGSAAHGMER